jgi:hypothetical protein
MVFCFFFVIRTYLVTDILGVILLLLKSQCKKFGKYVVYFWKRNSPSIQLVVDGRNLVESWEVADEFVISDLVTFKALKRLRASKSVRDHDIPDFVITGCSNIIVQVTKHIFNRSLPQQYFLSSWINRQFFPVLKKSNNASVSNYHHIFLIFPNYLNFLFMTMSQVTYSLNQIIASMISISLHVTLPIW